jgi:predicted HicB family RNase H-like nuclease
MKSDQHNIKEDIREKSGPDTSTNCSTKRLTLRLSLESKRKAHSIAIASNCSVSRVIEELLNNCTETPTQTIPHE